MRAIRSSNLLIIAWLFALKLSIAQAWSPSNGYKPSKVDCDDNINLVRDASSVSDNESDWLKKRNQVTLPALKDFLKRGFKNFTSDTSLIDNLLSDESKAPKIAVACSGGGYRAMLSGAGMLSAMDNRTDGANEHGLGGLLQSATYLAGLSGGNWLVGTLAYNNWTSVQAIVNNMTQDDSIWDISHSIVTPGGFNIFESISRWDDISDAVEDKKDAGYNTSITDIWGRALSYGFFPSLKDGGVGYTIDSLRDSDVFKNAEMPFPISLAVGRYPGTSVINLNATNFEFNPFEMGSWDYTLHSFTDIKYVGTNVSNGRPKEKGQCVAGYDNTGFVLGTSSSLFNQFLLQLNTTKLPKFLFNMIQDFLTDLSEDSDDISIWAPNPFRDVKNIPANYSQSISEGDTLYLVDGGEDGQNIPLSPLLQTERDVDVIFALDNSADTEEFWPNGFSLTQTYERQFGMQGKGIAFPYVPDNNTFVNLGLNKRPTFFGCDAKNLTNLEFIPPLIVYMPNTRESYNSNTSTFKMSYSTSERLHMIKNGFEAVTRNNFTQDSNFMGCVSCAILRRKQESSNQTLPDGCNACFKQYCWDGTVNSTTPEKSSTAGSSSQSASASASAASSQSTSTSSSTKKNDGPINDPKSALSLLIGGIATALMTI
ncbi:lysophospholipase [Kluyveromyces marxianus DMKU3-1042]|uniref:Lysophospholipase n=1 Tax=Kluyveromyces marxianus (strain DMKU3-1042 / BCC 29191 / NBRC 104275) TaxID=1003335 RepID=W0T2S9_KLUMD|nr:lysophospholipase [Kluyveromyces marxianus DMKU3-1042]BAO37882.1 lysophospholipase [Kluyveromyces marxianus DMKU3-1042]